MSEQIRIRVFADGSGKIITEGVEGSSCLDFAKLLEETMGADRTQIEYTSEYYSGVRDRTVILRQEEG